MQSLFQNSNLSTAIQPVHDIFLPESEQYLSKTLANALSARQPTAQLDLLLGAADLEAINFNREFYTFVTSFIIVYLYTHLPTYIAFCQMSDK